MTHNNILQNHDFNTPKLIFNNLCLRDNTFHFLGSFYLIQFQLYYRVFKTNDPNPLSVSGCRLIFLGLTSFRLSCLGRLQAFSAHHNNTEHVRRKYLCTYHPDIPVARTSPMTSPDAPVYPSIREWPPRSPRARRGLYNHRRLCRTI